MARRQTRSQRADKRVTKTPLPFAGVDGEGGDIDGTHEYLLLRAGKHLLETGRPLTPYECFGFLADLPKDRIYVSFAFDYDATMMIRSLPPHRIAALFDRKRREIFDPKSGKSTGQYRPVAVGRGEFEIDYMPHKEFKVRRKGCKAWTVISDTFTFFQSSFVRALRKWFDDSPQYSEHIERIAIGKEMRHDFGEVTEDEREYNALECVMLELLMERFRDLCTDLDIFPRKWQGPGNLVTAVFRREGMPSKFDIRVPLDVWEAANAAYFGGRFEASTYGLIKGPVYQYDINSAYASHYRDLPCLQHGQWEPITGLPDGEEIYFATVKFHHRNKASWYTVPVRSEKGTLLFPRTGIGTYWCHELNQLRKYADVEVESGFRYIRRCACRNFDWVYSLYDERDRVGKDSGHGKVLKTLLATIYGKLAQSKGHPIFANPIWSGLVVSHCRAKLVEAALQVDGGRDVLMLATDGLFCTSPRDLTVGRDLGEWTLEMHESIFIIQSGLYLMPDVSPKTRGVPQSKIVQLDSTFREVWETWISTNDFGSVPLVNVPLRVFVSARLAHARRKPWMAGTWREESKKVRFDWRTKRAKPRVRGTAIETLPVAGHRELRSQAPTWQIGGELDPARLLIEDQPDWGDTLVDA